MSAPVLLGCEDLRHGFGAESLFEGLSFSLCDGDHVGLVGPNGVGKSTLLRILAGEIEPDGGRTALRRGVRVGYVPQDPVFAPGRTVVEVAREALAEVEGLEDYERDRRAALALGKAGFADPNERTERLSGGWRKRLAIAREIAPEPDILLLDEPTNHLDVESILWLEALLRREPRAFVVVSHDRYFLEHVARRMLELDPSYPEGLLVVEGTYSELLEARDRLLEHQAAYQATLANLARRELEWLRSGVKARTTKAKARIETAERLQEELAESRARSPGAPARIELTASGRRTRRLWEGRGLAHSFGEKRIVRGLDLLLGPGDRLGVLGPNGSGKTTLLRMIVGEIEPEEGTVRRADGLRVVYFEQNREALDPEASLRRSLAPAGDSVVYLGRSLHVASWARRFLFAPEQLDTPLSRLSGGEKARVALARLMLRPADLLVLDEPTNDLDIPTLEVLEEALLEFAGALVLVTHDRYLLDRVSTRVLALDGKGGAEGFADYAQWEAERERRAASASPPRAKAAAERPRSDRPRLTYREQREWEGMEEAVLAAEARLEAVRLATEDPAVATDAAELQERFSALAAAQEEVDHLYHRWAELERKL